MDRGLKAINILMFGYLAAVTLACLLIAAFPLMDAAGYLIVGKAWAAERTVIVPWGDWVSSSLTMIGSLPIAEVVFGWIVAVLVKVGLPNQMADLLKSVLTEQVLQKAISYGINAVAGAVKGRQLHVTVANDVVANAVDYVVTNAPDWVVQWLGGAEGIKARILARIEIAPGGKVDAATQVVEPAPAAAAPPTPPNAAPPAPAPA